MNREEYINKLRNIFKWNTNSRIFFKNQINNYYNAKNNYKPNQHNYKVGDMVKLKKHQFMRGEGALNELNEDKLKFISANGFISPDFLDDFNLKKKTPLTVPVWNIQKDMLLKDYINLYRGATFKYICRDDKMSKTTCLVPYKKIDDKIEELRNKKYWIWSCEQTKEIRFMPNLAKDDPNVQALIMDVSNAKELTKKDIFNLDFDNDIFGSDSVDDIKIDTENTKENISFDKEDDDKACDFSTMYGFTDEDEDDVHADKQKVVNITDFNADEDSEEKTDHQEEQETSSVTDEDNSLSELNDLFNYLNNDDSFNN